MDEQQVEDIVKCSDCGSRSLTRDETRGEVVCDAIANGRVALCITIDLNLR